MGDCIIVSKIFPRTETLTVSSRSSSIDMGEFNNYRYIDTSEVPNSNSETYTPTTRAANIDMGAANTYRYVTTTSVPNSNSGTYTATTKSDKLDMGATNTYRYVKTSGIANVNDDTYTASSRGESLDMGAANTYRYVNTNSVPNSNSSTYSATARNSKIDMGATNSYRYVNTNGVPSTHTVSGYVFLSKGSTTTTTYNGIAILFTADDHPGGTLRLNSSSGTVVCNLYEGSYSGNYTTTDNGMILGYYVFSSGTKLYYTNRSYGYQGCMVLKLN